MAKAEVDLVAIVCRCAFILPSLAAICIASVGLDDSTFAQRIFVSSADQPSIVLVFFISCRTVILTECVTSTNLNRATSNWSLSTQTKLMILIAAILPNVLVTKPEFGRF